MLKTAHGKASSGSRKPTVIYDPQRITVDEMRTALQKTGTYKGILAPEE
jgi:hypothetical protein